MKVAVASKLCPDEGSGGRVNRRGVSGQIDRRGGSDHGEGIEKILERAKVCSRRRTGTNRRTRDEEHARSARNRGKERTLTLKIDSVYHVRNSICIHMRVKGPNIYVHIQEGRIYKEPLKKYNNKKANTYLLITNQNNESHTSKSPL
jgi:hypothetical protein